MKIDTMFGHHIMVFQNENDLAPVAVNIDVCQWFRIDWSEKASLSWQGEVAKLYSLKYAFISMLPCEIKTKHDDIFEGYVRKEEALLMGLAGFCDQGGPNEP